MSTPVLLETFTYLQRRISRDLAERWWESLNAVRFLERIECGHADMKAAMKYLARRDLHKLSLVDATSFELMRKHRLRVAFTFDTHFAVAGFRLKDRRKRESFTMYAFGILGDGERKSVEPIAARACANPAWTNNVHSKLCYFLGRSEWDDRAVRLEAARYALAAVQKREPITAWIVDDTGFLKQGTHSVGVQRQYTGSAGKVTNCQIGVSLAAATSSEQIPLDFELYLSRDVGRRSGAARRAEARIPGNIIHASGALRRHTTFTFL